MTSLDYFNWIEAFSELRQKNVRSFRLDRMKTLAALAGNPQNSAPSIHVAGSKGKGSTTAMIASILEAAGLSPGRYSSPHVSDYRERIGSGKGFFAERVYIDAGEELRAIVSGLEGSGNPLFDPQKDEGLPPTFFELMTLYFFLSCRRAGCKTMAVETGMGGRLDATNIIHPEVSLITSIELEHTEYLGQSIQAIAREKAGIIKAGRPLVVSAQNNAGEALAVFRTVAQEQASPLHNLSDEVSIENLSVQKTGSSFSLRFADNRIMQRLFVPIPGAVMATNAAAAILALNIAFKDKITEEAIRKGLSQTFLPGRFEARGNFIIDGAHTPRSTALCLETFEAVFGPGPWPALLFGCAASKDASAMAQLLASRFRHIVITRPGSYLSSRPEEVYAAFQNAAETLKSPKPDITFIEDTERAIVYVQTLLPPQSDIPVLGIGSFYLAGIIRGFTREKPLAPYQSPCSAPGRQSSNG